MILSYKLANEIVQRAMSIIHHNVNVIDKNGVIVASGDARRVGKIHDIGKEVALTKKRICVYAEQENESGGSNSVVSGINHPIIVDNELQFVVGVTGNPNEIVRYSELAFITAELLAKQAIENEHINWTTRIKDLQFVSLLNNKSLRSSLSCSKYKDIERSYNLPQYPLIMKVEVDDSYLLFVSEIIRKITQILGHENFGVVEQNLFFVLAKERDTLEQIIKEIDEIALKLKTRILFCKSFCAIDLESLISSIRLGIFCLNEGYNSSDSVISINSQSIINYLLHGEPCKEYFDYILTEILKSSKGEELIKTIRCYLHNNLEILKTTNELGIHRNTLQNRFKHIKELTHLDINKFDHLQIFHFALQQVDEIKNKK